MVRSKSFLPGWRRLSIIVALLMTAMLVFGSAATAATTVTVDIDSGPGPYSPNEIITITGVVSPAIAGGAVVLQVVDPYGGIAAVGEVSQNSNGEYEWQINTNSFYFSGDYTVYAAVPGTNARNQTTFNFIAAAVAAPKATPAPGTYDNQVTVSLSTSTEGALIYYTTDLSDPVTSETRTLYSKNSGITLTVDTTLKAVAVKDTTTSEVAEFKYYITVPQGMVAAPSANPGSGEYAGSVSLTLSSQTPNAQIYYTTDNSDPKTSSTKALYTAPINITQTTAIKAFAQLEGLTDSEVVTYNYIITPVAAPTAYPGTNTYIGGVSGGVTLSCTTVGAVIFYTTDGSDPQSSGTRIEYNQQTPVTITSTTTLIAVAKKNDVYSSKSTFVYTITPVAAPVADPAAGSYYGGANVQLTCSTPGALILYTTDGSDPKNGLTYGNAVTITSSVTIRAIAKVGEFYGSEGSFSYTITPIAAPVASPVAGNYTGGVNVSLTCATPGAQILYTTDGSDPKNGTPFDNPIVITATTTIRAIAKAGEFYGSEGNFSYTITPIAAPVASPVAGNYAGGVNVSLTCATPGAQILYTTDGSDPKNGTPFDNPIVITATTTIRAIAKVGQFYGSETSALYTIEAVAKPTANPAAGVYATAQVVELKTETQGAAIYYTTDGSDPTSSPSKQLYNNKIAIAQSTTVKAVAMVDGYPPSEIATFDYTILVKPTAEPRSCVFAAPIQVRLSTTIPGADIYYTTDGTRPTFNSNKYTGEIPVSKFTIINASTALSGAMTDPEVFLYEFLSPPVVTSPPEPGGGSTNYNGVQKVKLSAATGAVIVYTTDGLDPKVTIAANGTVIINPNNGDKGSIYTGPITVNRSITLKAIAVKAGVTSGIMTRVYTINIGSVKGHVRHGGMGMKDFKILVEGTNLSGLTDQNGAYLIEGIAPGTYVFVLTAKDGYNSERRAGVVVGAGASNPDIDFELTKGAIIRGRIMDSDGPAAGIVVNISSNSLVGPGFFASNDDPNTDSVEVTGSDGSFVIDGIKATNNGQQVADYYLSTWNAPDANGKPVYDDVQIFLNPQDPKYLLVEGSTTDIGDITLEKHANTLASISGQITMNGAPIGGSDIFVEAWSPATGSWGYDEDGPDANGNYLITGLEPGSEYEVTAFYGSLMNSYPEELTLTARQTAENINIALENTVTISGHVYDIQNSQGINGVEITASGRRGSWAQTTTPANVGNDGGFILSGLLPNDVYELSTINELGYIDRTVIVEVYGNDTIEEIGLTTGGTITGVVKDSYGTAIKNARIRVEYSNEEFAARAFSDDTGAFSVAGLDTTQGYALKVSKGNYDEETANVSVDDWVYNATDNVIDLGEIQLSLLSGYFSGDHNTFGADKTLVAASSSGKTSTVNITARYRNNASGPADNTQLKVSLPAGMTFNGGARIPKEASLDSSTNASNVIINLGNVPSGSEGTLSFPVVIGQDVKTDLTVSSRILYNNGVNELFGTVGVEVVHTDINGPEVARHGKVFQLYGESSPDASITIWYKRSSDAAYQEYPDKVTGKAKKFRADGRWWNAPVVFDDTGDYLMYAVAKIKGQSSSNSRILNIEIAGDADPVVDEIALSGGWNTRQVSNAYTGIPSISVAQGIFLDVDITFTGGMPSETKLSLGSGQPVNIEHLSSDGGKHVFGKTGANDFYIGFDVFGEKKLILSYKDSHNNTKEVAIAELFILIDPSGYVYDAKDTNPIEGIKAEVQWKESGVWKSWNAEKYGQVNPQFTDEDGRYGWDVPAGEYRVIFTDKNGVYQNYTSETVTVPPPKTDLNVGMIQLAALTTPYVTGISPEDGAMEISVTSSVYAEFSKEMNESTINSSSFLLKNEDDDLPVSGSISCEDNQNGCTRAVFAPDANLTPGKTYEVTLKGDIEDNDGNKLSSNYPQGYSWTFDTVEPSGAITVQTSLNYYSPGNPMTIFGWLFEDGVGQQGETVCIDVYDSLNNILLSVQEATYEGGWYSTPEMAAPADAGVYTVRAASGEASNSCTFTVLVVDNPAASPGEGSYTGSVTVSLSTETQGAKIYYTADGSDPRTSDTRQEYVSGLVFTSDTLLRAVAVKEGIFSDIAEFNYTFSPITEKPAKISTVPADSATNVDVNTEVSATFNLNLELVDASGIKINDVAVGVSNVSISGNKLTISHSSFNGSTKYTVVIPAGSVKSTVYGIGNDAVSWSFTTKSSGGGGGTTPAETKQDYATPVVNDIQSQAGKDQIELTATEKELGVSLSADAWNEIVKTNKPVVVTSADKSVSITILPGTLNVPAGASVKITASSVSQTDADAMLKNLQPNYQAFGRAFELSVVSVSAGKETALPFDKEMQVSFPYGDLNVNAAEEGCLGVYRYNDQSKEWEYVGGRVDTAKKTVTVDIGHFSKYTLLVYSKTFKDIAGHWAENDLEIMIARHIAVGMTEDSFMPNSQITRAQFAVLLTRIMGASYDPAKAPAFADVPKDAWYARDLAAAYAAGLIKGYSATAFGPEDPVTREQVASMMVRALSSADLVEDISDSQAQDILSSFSDNTQVSRWAVKVAAQAVELNVIRGYSDNTFRPQGNATRAEGIVMLKRVMDQLPD